MRFDSWRLEEDSQSPPLETWETLEESGVEKWKYNSEKLQLNAFTTLFGRPEARWDDQLVPR